MNIMRDLTEEELKLAPDWATHYYAYADGDILFECDTKFTLYSKGSGLMLVTEMCSGVSSETVLLNQKPFDITKHEFEDTDIKNANITVESDYLHFEIMHTQLSELIVSKQDAIAIAKALGVTGDDL